MAKQENTGKTILYIAISAVILSGLGFAIYKIIKSQRKIPADKNDVLDPETWGQKQGVIAGDGNLDPGTTVNSNRYDPSMYTIWDNDNGGLNANGKSIAASLQDELFAWFYTDSDKVESLMRALKTQGDVAVLSNYWNQVIAPEHDKRTLSDKIRLEVSPSVTNDIMDYLNKLPLHI